MTEQPREADLEAFDQGWLEVIQQTPWIKDLYALVGLTRLGEHPVSLERLAAVVDRPLEETETLIQREFKTRIEGGLIYWDDPYPGDQTRRTVYIGDRQVPMGSGCGPDVFGFAAVLDVPFRVEETDPTTGTPIRVDFVPDGCGRTDPPEVVTILLSVEDLRPSTGKHFEEINADVCSFQPLFASAEAAEPWLAARPGSRVFTVKEMFQRSWYINLRDTLRPRIYPSNPGREQLFASFKAEC
jgi:hypothetical protein